MFLPLICGVQMKQWTLFIPLMEPDIQLMYMIKTGFVGPIYFCVQ